MIPTPDKEALDELKRVRDGNAALIRGINELVGDGRYPNRDRESLAILGIYITQIDDIIAEVMKGMATMAVAKKPSDAASIIDALTK